MHGRPVDYEFPVTVLSEEHRDEYLSLVSTLLHDLRSAAESKAGKRAR